MSPEQVRTVYTRTKDYLHGFGYRVEGIDTVLSAKRESHGSARISTSIFTSIESSASSASSSTFGPVEILSSHISPQEDPDYCAMSSKISSRVSQYRKGDFVVNDNFDMRDPGDRYGRCFTDLRRSLTDADKHPFPTK